MIRLIPGDCLRLLQIRNAHDHLKQDFPRIVFAEKAVDEIK